MKTSLRISSVILLSAIYCLTLSIGSEPLNYSNIQTSKQEKYLSTISTILSPHTSPSESSVNNFNDFPAPSFKNLFNEIWAITKTTEQLYKTIFSQYISFSINFLIHHRKTDIIFPFHYFW